MAVECVSRTDVGLRRKVNEDSLLARPERGLWVVADGMGGHEAGDVASALVVEALAHLPETERLDDTVNEAITALVRVNRGLLRLANANGTKRTIGSTVVGLAIEGDRYRCFWAGDSRAYRARGDTIVQLSRDHSLVQDLVRAGMLSAADAKNHPNTNIVTRAVGVAETLKVETADGDVAPGDLFLLASDGLTGLVPPDELLAGLRTRPLAKAADDFVETALARGAPDNVTLIIVSVT